MTRYHATPNGPVPFTPEEEIEWDIQEAEWLAQEPERKAAEIRAERDALIAPTDWTQLADSPLPNTVREQWAVYRQALRDVPEQPNFPENVTWPVAPGSFTVSE